jgi:hypothetical protein
MSQDNQQEKNHDKNPQESTEEFYKRLGIKRVRGEKGGVEFVPGKAPVYMSDCPRCGARRLYDRACPQCGFPPHFPMHHSQVLSDEELREWDSESQSNEQR